MRFPAALALAATICGCAPIQPYPDGYAACYARMRRHADDLLQGFAALGYRPAVKLQLDEKMPDAYGLNSMQDVLGDAKPDGRIRLRASAVCADDELARAVVAHEMAHVALEHRGSPSTGLVLAWEGPPKNENEANALGLAVLRRIGGHPLSERQLECRLTDCAGMAGPRGTPAFRELVPRPAP